MIKIKLSSQSLSYFVLTLTIENLRVSSLTCPIWAPICRLSTDTLKPIVQSVDLESNSTIILDVPRNINIPIYPPILPPLILNNPLGLSVSH